MKKRAVGNVWRGELSLSAGCGAPRGLPRAGQARLPTDKHQALAVTQRHLHFQNRGEQPPVGGRGASPLPVTRAFSSAGFLRVLRLLEWLVAAQACPCVYEKQLPRCARGSTGVMPRQRLGQGEAQQTFFKI